MNVRQKKYARKSLPQIWLMTDPRMDECLLVAVQCLRFRSGVILRHYHLEPTQRKALFRALRSICKRRGHKLFLAGDERTALRWGADGFHNRTAPFARARNFPRSAPVHNAHEIALAQRNGADLLFLSPIFATQSHADKRPLGPFAFNRLAKLATPHRVIALGGMNACKAAMLSKSIDGWAGIDAFRKPPTKR
jgi:thiamine-phosphate pyrophosphorylase